MSTARDRIMHFPFLEEGDQGRLRADSQKILAEIETKHDQHHHVFIGPQRVHRCSKTPTLSFLRLSSSIIMVAKPKSTSVPADADAAPRRSARIKEQPKAEAEPVPKKAPAKPRSKKPKTDEEEKGDETAAPPKSRGKKRKAEDAEDGEPPAKKVHVNQRPFDILTYVVS